MIAESTSAELPEFRELGIPAVRLMQGVIYAQDQDVWDILLSYESDLTDYFARVGLVVVIDRSEGLAYLRQFGDGERVAGYERLPRLFRRTALGYDASRILPCACWTRNSNSRSAFPLMNCRFLCALWKHCRFRGQPSLSSRIS